MRKNTVTHLPQIQKGALNTEVPKRDLWGAQDLTEQAIDRVRQLRALSHTMAEIGPTLDSDETIDTVEVVHTMALFSQNLEHVHDLLTEVRVVMETVNRQPLASGGARVV